jgi:hypothetical protein
LFFHILDERPPTVAQQDASQITFDVVAMHTDTDTVTPSVDDMLPPPTDTHEVVRRAGNVRFERHLDAQRSAQLVFQNADTNEVAIALDRDPWSLDTTVVHLAAKGLELDCLISADSKLYRARWTETVNPHTYIFNFDRVRNFDNTMSSHYVQNIAYASTGDIAVVCERNVLHFLHMYTQHCHKNDDAVEVFASVDARAFMPVKDSLRSVGISNNGQWVIVGTRYPTAYLFHIENAQTTNGCSPPTIHKTVRRITVDGLATTHGPCTVSDEGTHATLSDNKDVYAFDVDLQ